MEDKNKRTLLALKKSLKETAAAVPPKELPLGRYSCVRHGVKKVVHVVEVKGDRVVFKEALDRLDAQTIPRAKFEKFYRLEEVAREAVEAVV